MKFLMTMSSMVSFLYWGGSHPVMLMAFILMQTMSVCIAAWVKLKISWFSYILFLIFLGGLMVLFVYITSLASNEMMAMKISSLKMPAASVMFMMILLTSNLNFQLPMANPSAPFKTFYFMYSWNLMALITLTMVYLLLTLIIVVSISNKFEAPIKNLVYT